MLNLKKLKTIMVALFTLILSCVSYAALAQVPVLNHPINSTTIFQTIPYFDWQDHVAEPYAGEYQIEISQDVNFTSITDTETIPAIISHYSTNIELVRGSTYFWRVRYGDAEGVFTDWSSVASFSLGQPHYIDVVETDDWSDIKTKLDEVVAYTTNNPGEAAELRFPVNGVFNLVQENYDPADRSTEYLFFLDGFFSGQTDQILDNVLIDGRGSSITIRAGGTNNNCGFFYLRKSNHVQLRNFTLDYENDSLRQYGGIISNLDKTTREFDVTVDHVVYNTFEEMADYADGYFLEATSHQKVGDKGTIYRMEDSWRNAKTGPNTYHFTAGNAEWSRYQGELKNGDYFVTSHRGGDLISLFGTNTDTVVNNLMSLSSRGVLFISRVEPGDPNKWTRSIGNSFLRSANRFMGSSSGGVNDKTLGSWYEDNRYEYTRDDAFHNGEHAGSEAVVLNNTMIGAFRNSLWVQADRSWTQGNTTELGGELGMQLGGAGQVTAGSRLELLNHAIVKNNTIRKSRKAGIHVRTNTDFFPDLEVGFKNQGLILTGNTVEDHLSGQGMLLTALANSEVSDNVVQSTQSQWQYYSDADQEIGISVGIDVEDNVSTSSHDLTGSGNLVTDSRISSNNHYLVFDPSTNISTQVNGAIVAGSQAPESVAHLQVLSDDSLITFDWPDSSDSNFSSYTLLRKHESESVFDIGAIATGLTSSEHSMPAPSIDNGYQYAVQVVDNQGRISTPAPFVDYCELSAKTFEHWDDAVTGVYSGVSTVNGNLSWDIKANNFEVALVNDSEMGSVSFARLNDLAIPGGSLVATDAHSASLPTALDVDEKVALQFKFKYDELTTLGRNETFVGVRSSGSGETMGLRFYSQTSNTAVKLIVNNKELDIVPAGQQVADQIWSVNLEFDKIDADTTLVKYRVESTEAVIASDEITVADALVSTSDIDQIYITVRQRSFSVVDGIQVSAGTMLDTTPPAAPTGLTQGTLINRGVNISWLEPSNTDVSFYRVYARISGESFAVALDDYPFTSGSIKGLTNASAYELYVTAVDFNGNESAASNSISFTTIPNSPVDVQITANDSFVTLDWAGNTDSTFASYSVYRSDISYREYQLLASNLTSSDYTDTAVTNGDSYYYKVLVADTGGNLSSYSAELSAIPGKGVFYENFDTTGVLTNEFNNSSALAVNNTWAINATNFVANILHNTPLLTNSFGRKNYDLVAGGLATATDRHTALLERVIDPISDTTVVKARIGFITLTTSGRAEARVLVFEQGGSDERYSITASAQTSSAPFKLGVNNSTLDIGNAGEQDTNAVWDVEMKFTRVGPNSTTVSYTIVKDGVVTYQGSGINLAAGLATETHLTNVGIELRQRAAIAIDEIHVSYE